MGITGLLPLMKGATTDVKLAKLSGTVAAIDTNGWIHRACYSCGDKVYMKEETDMYINYCVNFCALLRKHNITPILVFDGQSLPAKAETKLKRQQRKDSVKEQIEELLRTGKTSQARYLMRTCVDVTFEMVHRVIVRCREEHIDYMVAPFEADAQITYLVNYGIADYAITEDSDMLVFGCRKMLCKLDRESESGKMITLDRLGRCFKNFDERKFQFMCILSGCDYLANIPNVGIGRARKFFESLVKPLMSDLDLDQTIRDMLLTIPTVLNMKGKAMVTNEYIDGFIKAVRTFDHQLVFCPFRNNLTHLKRLKNGLDDHHRFQLGRYAGDFFHNGLVQEISFENKLDFVHNYVLGNVHPKTLQSYDCFDPFSVKSMYQQSQEDKVSTLALDDAIWWSKTIVKRVETHKTMVLNGMNVCSSTPPIITVIEDIEQGYDDNDTKSTKSTIKNGKRKYNSTSPSLAKGTKITKRTSSSMSSSTTIASPDSSVKITANKSIRSSIETLKIDDDNKRNTNGRSSLPIITNRTTPTTTITTKRRQTSRNVFAIAQTTTRGGKSSYFRTSTTTAATTTTTTNNDSSIVSAHKKSMTVIKSSSPLKSKNSSSNNNGFKQNQSSDEDSDFDEIILLNRSTNNNASSSTKQKIDLDVSVSSIEDEDRIALQHMNSNRSSPPGTQSSGYGSQYTASQNSISSSQSSSSSNGATADKNIFTKLRSPSSSSSTTTTSKRMSTSSTKVKNNNTTPKQMINTRSCKMANNNSTPTNSTKDIRNFFAKRANQ